MDIRLGTAFTAPGLVFPREIFRDTFDRPDAPTLGVTSEFQIPWAISVGANTTAATFGIEGNAGKMLSWSGASNGFAAALLDVHQRDFQVTWVLAARATAMRLPICARDADNAIYASCSATGAVNLLRTTNGSSAFIAQNLPVVNVGDTLRARFTGATLLVWINGAQIYNAPLTAVPTDYTKTGFGAVGNANGGRVDQITLAFP